MQVFDFIQVESEIELFKVLSNNKAKIVAGGTDIIPRMRKSTFPADILVDIQKLSSLKNITKNQDRIEIGALVTHQMLMDSTLIQDHLPSLAAAAESVGCIQTRCRGTLGGNLANASPAGDTIPPLLTVDAVLVTGSQSGEREVSLRNFFSGPGQTALKEGEYIKYIRFSVSKDGRGTGFQKLGKRKGMAISVVNAAAALELNSAGEIRSAAVALGSVSPTVVCCQEAEEYLLGRKPTEDVFNQASEICRESVSPISDVRSTNEYRRHAAGVLAFRALEQAASRANDLR